MKVLQEKRETIKLLGTAKAMFHFHECFREGISTLTIDLISTNMCTKAFESECVYFIRVEII